MLYVNIADGGCIYLTTYLPHFYILMVIDIIFVQRNVLSNNWLTLLWREFTLYQTISTISRNVIVGTTAQSF